MGGVIGGALRALQPLAPILPAHEHQLDPSWLRHFLTFTTVHVRPRHARAARPPESQARLRSLKLIAAHQGAEMSLSLVK